MEQRIRVLLEDLLVDFKTDQYDPALWSELNPRDAYYAEVVEQQILARGQRALLIGCGGHFTQISDSRLSEGNVFQSLDNIIRTVSL